MVVVFRARGIEVKAGDLGFGHDKAQILLNFLSTKAMHTDVGAVANGTFARHTGRVTAIMATQHVLALVIDKAHVTVDALRHIVTFVALQTQRETAPVLEQDGLVVFVQSLLHRIEQGAAKVGLHGFAPTFHAHVAKDDFGHLHTAIALCNLHQMVAAIQGIIIAFV